MKPAWIHLVMLIISSIMLAQGNQKLSNSQPLKRPGQFIGYDSNLKEIYSNEDPIILSDHISHISASIEDGNLSLTGELHAKCILIKKIQLKKRNGNISFSYNIRWKPNRSGWNNYPEFTIYLDNSVLAKSLGNAIITTHCIWPDVFDSNCANFNLDNILIPDDNIMYIKIFLSRGNGSLLFKDIRIFETCQNPDSELSITPFINISNHQRPRIIHSPLIMDYEIDLKSLRNQVSYGLVNKELYDDPDWQRIKKHIRKGDQLWGFSCGSNESYHSGYCLVRNNVILWYIVTSMV